MRISDWSSDVCSSDLIEQFGHDDVRAADEAHPPFGRLVGVVEQIEHERPGGVDERAGAEGAIVRGDQPAAGLAGQARHLGVGRSEEHTSELQSLMRISYAVFCLKKKKKDITQNTTK